MRDSLTCRLFHQRPVGCALLPAADSTHLWQELPLVARRSYCSLQFKTSDWCLRWTNQRPRRFYYSSIQNANENKLHSLWISFSERLSVIISIYLSTKFVDLPSRWKLIKTLSVTYIHIHTYILVHTYVCVVSSSLCHPLQSWKFLHMVRVLQFLKRKQIKKQIEQSVFLQTLFFI